MADILIETLASNPYESIVADTSTQISDLDAQIQQVSSAITTLEQEYPTSPTLSQLRERLSSLQSRKNGLTETNNSAKTLMESYNNSLRNSNTLKGIYDLKENQLNKEKSTAEREYNSMAEDTKRIGQNYINTLGNATASENAIINANAGRQGASAQSTAEVRARNYLNNAQAQNEAANQTIQNVNAIREGKINTNAGYAQLSQSNADNTLRQQVMNDFQASEAQKDRDLQERLTDKQLATQRAISASSSSSKGKYTDKDVEEAFSKYTDELKKSFGYDNMSDEEKIAFEIKIGLRDPEEETKK